MSLTRDSKMVNLEAEMCLLGAFLLSEKQMDIVGSRLSGDEFWLPAHRVIFKAIESVFVCRGTTDLVILKNLMTEEGSLTQVGGIEYLKQVLDVTPAAANARHYSDVVTRLYRARQAHQAMLDASELLAAGDLDDGMARVSRIAEKFDTEGQSVFSMDDVMSEPDDEDKGSLTSGLCALDKMGSHEAGIWPIGDFSILGAGTGKGKTFMLAQTAVALAKQGKRFIFASYELSRKQLRRRFVRMVCGFRSRYEAEKCGQGYLWDDAWEDVSNWKAKILDTSDRFGYANLVEDLASTCRRMHADEGLDAILVDYAGLLSSKSGGEGWENQAVCSRTMKRLCQSLGVAGVVAAQMQSDEKSGDIVTKGSRVWCDDAAAIVVIGKKGRGDEESPCLYLTKNRHGRGTGEILVRFRENQGGYVEA